MPEASGNNPMISYAPDLPLGPDMPIRTANARLVLLPIGVAFYFLAIGLSYYTGDPLFQRAAQSVGTLLFLGSALPLNSSTTPLLALIFFLSALFVLNLLLVEPDLYLTGLYPIATAGVALAIWRTQKLFEYYYFFFLLFLLGFLGYVYYQGFILGTPGNYVFEAGSRNHIVTLGATLYAILSLLTVSTNTDLHRFPAAITLFICSLFLFWFFATLTGRTGVIVGALFIIAALHLLLFSRRKSLYSLLFAVLVIAGSIGTMAYAPDLLEKLTTTYAFERLVANRLESARWTIWASVIHHDHEWTAFFGAPNMLSRELTGYGWHSSYLEAWTHYGVIGLLLVLASFSWLSGHLLKNNIFAFLIVSALLFRSFFDTSLFGSLVPIPLFLAYFLFSRRTSPQHRFRATPPY